MIKVAVCDDEIQVLKSTQEMLKEYKKTPCQVTLFQSGEALLQSNEKFDIILLDIDMDGMNGIETAKRIRNVDKEVTLIYVTSYSDYSIFAFAVHAFAYLLKPLKKEELFNQLDEVAVYQNRFDGKEMELITKEGVIRIRTEEILYFEYQNRQVILKSEKQSWHLKTKITEVAQNMQKYGFEMPHKSFVVNLYAVASIHGYDIYMTDGSIVPLSQKKSADFRKRLNQYLAGRRDSI